MIAYPATIFAQPYSVIGSVPDGAVPLALADLAHVRGGNILHVATTDRAMERLASGIAFFAPDVEVLMLPAWDCLPYDRASPNPAIIARRIATLSALAYEPAPKHPRIVLTTVNASLQRIPMPSTLKGSSFHAKISQRLDRGALLEFLQSNGYRRTGKAMEPGEYALRGSIIDLIPPGSGDGFRLDLFGDELDTIRRFDPLAQTSLSNENDVDLLPVNEILLTEDAVARFREGYRMHFGAVAKDDPLYEAVSEGRHYSGMEHWLPLFHAQLATLFDYVPDAVITLGHQVESAQEERVALVQDYYHARIEAPKPKGNTHTAPPYYPLPPELLYLDAEAWDALAEKHSVILLSPFAGESNNGFNLPYRGARKLAKPDANRSLYDLLRDVAAGARAEGKATLVACYTGGSRARIETMLSEQGFHCVRIDAWPDVRKIGGKSIGLTVFAIEQGFETDHTLVLSEQDLLGERVFRTQKKKRAAEHFLAEAANFMEGELVVHKEHGIARFDGLVTLEVSGARHDCLKLVYDGDDKLFLPVENIDLVSRYGSEDEGAKLDKLGGASWQARKARLKERITIAAEALLKTAAERSYKTASVLHAPTGLYDEFAGRFPYQETEDQERAIADVLEDLGAGKPMDRLICGDVGFGKTEVALRAAFAAVSAVEGKSQVALICPTTLLARQHYLNFKTRFEHLPFEVRMLSRLTPAKQAKETRELLKEGKVDVVIGTHALLAKTVAFQNLGLLVVDEEQHFGVGQKEKLKALKADVHVLTLSATPIPRTLQMALTGVRDLSLITTPPVDRLAVRTFVMPFDTVVIREALMREFHRGGKSFVVCPRVKDIGELKLALSAAVPEVKIAVAHGQLPPTELEHVMTDFYDGKSDVLLSTAIIESGIDIPTANTLIVTRSNMFGLSQLYQLRGRVGRSKTRAYAYFTLPHQKTFSQAAVKRLEVMQTLDSLGAGFSVASHDMDIRGFGNLVGEEQSGHVREVGIELYQQMLEEAVTALKAQRKGEKAAGKPNSWSPQINLGMAVLIPEEYVGDLNLRMGLYKRAASLSTQEELDSFAAELVDRFGPLPEEVEHLLSIMRIKQLCLAAGVERVDAGPKGIVLSFRENKFSNPEALLAYIAKQGDSAKLRPDHKLVLIREWKDEQEKIKGVVHSIGEIVTLAA